MKRRRFYFSVAGLLILFYLGIVFWFCFFAFPLRISRETTLITEPLTPDGRVDYFRAFEESSYPSEMKTDDNGYRLIVRRFGDLARRGKHRPGLQSERIEFVEDDPEPYRIQVYEKLGLDPGTPPAFHLKLEDLSCYRYLGTVFDRSRERVTEESKDWVTGEVQCSLDLWQVVLNAPATSNVWGYLEDWFEKIDPLADALDEAVRKPVFSLPLTRESETHYIPFHMVAEGIMLHEFACLLKIRANYRIGIGNLDGAIDDTMTCYRLARHLRRSPVSELAWRGDSIEYSIASSIRLGANPDAPLNRDQIRRLLDAITDLPPPLPNETNSFETRRLFLLSLLQCYARNDNPFDRGLFGHGFESPVKYRFDLDWNFVMQSINERFETSRHGDSSDMPPEPKVSPLAPLTVRGRSEAFVEYFSQKRLSSFFVQRDVGKICQCFENIKRLTLALLLYEKDHGELPKDDWHQAIRPYLGKNAGACFRCPAADLATSETGYAMIRRDSGKTPKTPYTLLIAEVVPPLELSDGDGMLPESSDAGRIDIPSRYRPENRNRSDGFGSPHTSRFAASFRHVGVEFLHDTTEPEHLERLLEGTAPCWPLPRETIPDQ